jgi:hypothetical protein
MTETAENGGGVRSKNVDLCPAASFAERTD